MGWVTISPLREGLKSCRPAGIDLICACIIQKAMHLCRSICYLFALLCLDLTWYFITSGLVIPVLLWLPCKNLYERRKFNKETWKCELGLHDISFQHRYCDVHIRDSHIARCAMFSRPILIVIFILIIFFAHTQTPCLHRKWQLYRHIHFEINLVAELLQVIFSAGNPFILWNFRIVVESAGHGCLATADATKAQALERFGKKEKAARQAFSMCF